MLIRALCQVIAGPTVEPHPLTVLMGEETKAVMLDLVQPHLAGVQCLSFGREAPGDEAGGGERGRDNIVPLNRAGTRAGKGPRKSIEAARFPCPERIPPVDCS